MTNSRLPLEELLLSAVASYAKASPVERAIMALEQRRSYARSCCSSTISVEAAERILNDFPEFILLAAYRELHESHRELERKLAASIEPGNKDGILLNDVVWFTMSTAPKTGKILHFLINNLVPPAGHLEECIGYWSKERQAFVRLVTTDASQHKTFIIHLPALKGWRYLGDVPQKVIEPQGHTVIPCGTGLLCTACGMLFTNKSDDGIKTAFNASGPCPGLLADPLP